MAAIIMQCNCTHEGQDALHGKGNRVHNVSGIKDKPQAFCTVCCSSSRDKQKDDVMPMPTIGIHYKIPKRAPRNGKSIVKSQIK